MKLLLTSNGLSNKAIAQALLRLAGKPASATHVAFIPTSANAESGDKDWLINDLNNLRKQKFKSIDLVDISALPRTVWLPRLKKADVLFFGGGNTVHLIYWFRKSGLIKLLPNLLKTRVYAGISAGSIVAAPTIALSSDHNPPFKYEDPKFYSKKGLNLVNFYNRPHFNTPEFPKASAHYLIKRAKEIPGKIYALGDQSAVVVDGERVSIVGKGPFHVFNT